MIRNILIPLDGSTTAERALPHAAALSHVFDAQLTLARVPETMVVPVMSGAVWTTEEVETQEATAHTEQYLAEVAGRDELAGLEVQTLTPPHPVTSGLLAAIDESNIDLVVMTTHGYSGFKRFVFGSVADKLIRVAPAPVYIVREPDGTEPPRPVFRTVLVPLDGSDLGERALDSAAALARATGAQILLVQVPTVPGYVTGIPETAGWIPRYLQEQTAEATTYLREHAARLSETGLPTEIDVEVVTAGGVADGVLKSAAEHDASVIVMSTHGRSGLGRWVFGSVADQLMRVTERPVWLVRAHDKES